MAGGARMTIDNAAIRRLGTMIAAEASERAARVTANRVKANIRQSGRVDTGGMVRGIKPQPKQGSLNAWEIVSDKPYTSWQEEGIGPVVAPKGKILRFKPKGTSGFIFRPRTKGFAGAHFFKRAYKQLTLTDFLP